MKNTIEKESELKEWFIKNHQKLGYRKIVRKDIGIFPDFIVLNNQNKEVRVELETKASNFILHKHSMEEVDEIVCIKKDIKLPKSIKEVKQLKFKEPSKIKVTLSIEEEIYNSFQKFCEENAVMLSKRIELLMKKEMENKKRNERGP